MKALEQKRQLRRSNAYAAVRHAQFNMGRAPAKPDCDAALEGVLERIGKEVEHDLLPHLPVHIDQLRQAGAVYCESQACLLHRRAEHTGEFGCMNSEVRWFI